ncbi:MAG: hypothetical protein HKO65_17785 [Gemmatimonadetes bacterium]|nr:hypothetical protein [Gemmatimonadota bacterium]
MADAPKGLGKVLGRPVLLSQAVFLVVAFAYFFFAANYVLYFQETQTLFLFSGEFLREHFSRPGGPLAYGAEFLTQFYARELPGSLIVAVVLTLPGVVLFFVKRRLSPDVRFTWVLLLVPSCLLLILQANYYHLMEYNLGLLLVLLFYLFSITSDKRYQRVLVLALVPLFYFLAGAFALVFAGMFACHVLFLQKGKGKYPFTFLLLAITGGTFLVFWKVLFLEPMRQIAWYPLPLFDTTGYNTTLSVLAGYLILFPLLARDGAPAFPSGAKKRFLVVSSVVALVSIGITLVVLEYDLQTARVVEIERSIYAEEWGEAIEAHENRPSRDRIGQYFYNVALSETGQLCDRLFRGTQDFGPASLVLPWEVQFLNSGAYYYYAIGLANEAHRWAYEDMVVYGYRPQNLQILAKTTLISGDFRMAKKYAGILKNTVYYRDWAADVEEIADNPDLLVSHPDLLARSKLLPKENFFIEYDQPENNLPLLLEAQPDNRKALEYLLAGLLLIKNVDAAVSHVGELKDLGYERIPRHLEEAALIFVNTSDFPPNLGGLEISPSTQVRFDRYSAAYAVASRDPQTLRARMEEEFGDTYWFYFQFR